jgi:hypothetical protein
MKNLNVSLNQRVFSLRSGILISLMTVVGFASCTKAETLPVLDLAAQISALPLEPLNDNELHYLQLMREEEKLAYDVYATLYGKWGVNVFLNISSSEQSHTGSVLALLNKYNLQDPVNNNPVGIFTDLHLQQLYTELVTQGSKTILDAYIIGATIEDLDIFDLKNAILETDNQDINLVWENLSMGSRNHMRSFTGQIVALGSSYSSQFISQEELLAIISSPRENNKP